ncbi:FecR domain-containing protein [Acidovorax sp. Leaf78]|uniref:FecR family protein n=1 Tax=unclassified Acidovorax TaxID=2684926 RepID=UPI0006F6D721|nr:FecR domain-containing protein [Acidovorax sp. Leaf78]KQO17023.1 histidine kinase [Acidovorax sp. Leaf78]
MRTPIPDPVAQEEMARQAAEWIVQLTADGADERDRARRGFEAWKATDPRHAAAAAEMESLLGQVQSMRERAGGFPQTTQAAKAALRAGLARPRSGARRVGVAMACALAVSAWCALQAWPAGYLLAGLRTSTGQWQSHILADGSHLTLGSASAVNVRYGADGRTVELVQGEILVDVARDGQALAGPRPFDVETPEGRIRALGTRFAVRRMDMAEGPVTELTMLESTVAVQQADGHPAGGEGTRVHAGERVRITRHGVGAVQPVDVRSAAQAWAAHQLVANDRPLSEVLDELARHRPGHLRYDRSAIEGIRVSAVLPLDDTDQALQLLLTSFPQLRVRTLTPWLVLVDVQS